ncbi:MAG: hypothetical protein HZA35_00860 [Parcubacteria group bacterium]|nr:hypothetical protein [Parcubacteria group bacterium]
MNEVKMFYDPHPGFAGAAIAIPHEVRRVANELNGNMVSLGEAVARIQAVTNGKVEVVERYQFIALHLKQIVFGIQCEHYFRVIRYHS